MGLSATGNPVRILDVLETDGGWSTTAYVAMLIDASERTTDRALHRLRVRGLVESRVEEVTNHKNHIRRRVEWRTV